MDFRDLTTLHLGGPAREFVSAESASALIAAVREADAAQRPLLVIGGGSNLVVSDDGFDGTVIRVDTRGIQAIDQTTHMRLEVQAGEPWSEFVSRCVAHSWSGVECLAGIPGLVGATPMQNVGAYGQEVKDTITHVRVWDRHENREREFTAEECAFDYRTSFLKVASPRFVVLSVVFLLKKSMQSAPIRYAELASALSIREGEMAPVDEVAQTIVRLRKGKGMVVDASDPESSSAGSFFMNPTVSPAELLEFTKRVNDRLGDIRAPQFPAANGKTKLAAAWLIERAGFAKGFGSESIGISKKHALALVHRGNGSTRELLALAKTIRDGVRDAFGIELMPEPQMVGCSLDALPVN